MGFAKPIEQYLFGNLLTKMHVFMYLKDIIRGAQVMRKNEKITALYERLSRDDFGKDDDQQRESNSISNQEILCRGWFLPPNTYDCGSFVVNGTAVIGKE